MGWDKNNRYYSRSRRVNGRVVREYIGGGKAGELVAQFDEMDRDRREEERMAERGEREEMAALDAPVIELVELTELVARAVLLAAGFHQHHRGEWRKKRGRRKQDDRERNPEDSGPTPGVPQADSIG